MKYRLLLALCVGIGCFPFAASSQIDSSDARPISPSRDPLAVFPRDRISATIRDTDTVAIANHRHPRARPEDDAGAVPANLKMTRMILALKPEADQQAAMDELAAAQQSPRSAQYHQWLTPQSFGAHFGASQNDLDQIAAWLRSEGFTIDEIPAGHSTIVFSGTASQVERAFHVAIHYFRSAGQLHFANAGDPQIPKALAGLISSIEGLHDFRARPAAHFSKPQTSGLELSSFLEPSDFATIYNLNPLYSAGINGHGATIGVLEPCTVDSAVINAFQSLENLPQQFNDDHHGTPITCTAADYLPEGRSGL